MARYINDGFKCLFTTSNQPVKELIEGQLVANPNAKQKTRSRTVEKEIDDSGSGRRRGGVLYGRF